MGELIKKQHFFILFIIVFTVLLVILKITFFPLTPKKQAKIVETEGNFFKYGPVGATTTVYYISQPKGTLPRFINVIIDPLDVKVGDLQTFKAKVYSPYEIVSVITETQLDNEKLILPLKKTGIEDTDGSWWEVQWKVRDTHVNIYRTKFIAKDKKGNISDFTLTWTDPCSGIPQGGDGSLTANCTVSSVDGVDNGNLTSMNGYTLTINSTGVFVFNPGKYIKTNGTIAIANGGKIVQGYLFYDDADRDGYAPNTVQSYSLNPSVAGKVRRYAALGTSDCDDSDPTRWRLRYLDQDNDSYCPNSNLYCVGNHVGYRDSCTGFNDCYDLNRNAKPGQTNYFTVHRGDGSFDYDCDGIITRNPSLNCITRFPASCSNLIAGSYSNGWDSIPACGQSGNWYSGYNYGQSTLCGFSGGGAATCANLYVAQDYYKRGGLDTSKVMSCK